MDLEQEAQAIIDEALRDGSPTEGQFAAHVWGWSNSRDVPTQLAMRTMRAAGYEPFMGYPLTRAKSQSTQRLTIQ